MNRNESKVSIIVPIYNAEVFLYKCIDSIKKQTYSNIEIILVDDGSKDRSAHICQEYVHMDARVQYIYQDNGGVAAARNNGIRHASGNYVLFVDSDDRIPDDAVEIMVGTMIETNCDLVVSGYAEEFVDHQVVYAIEKETITGVNAIRDYYACHFRQAIASSVWAKLYKREYIQTEFQENITMGEDFLFNIDYFQCINSLSAVSGPLYLYNKTNENSLVRNYKESYYHQNLYVCQYANSWLVPRKDKGVSLVNIQAKMAYSFFEFFFFLVEGKNTVEDIKARMSKELDDAIRMALIDSAQYLGSFRKIVAQLLLRGNYTMAIILTKIYLKLHD